MADNGVAARRAAAGLLEQVLGEGKMLSEALGAAERPRQSKIVADVLDYHASTDALIELGEQSNVDMVAFYHLVPVPLNDVLEDVFKRGMPDNFLLAKDLMWFDLPIDSDEIIVNVP